MPGPPAPPPARAPWPEMHETGEGRGHRATPPLLSGGARRPTPSARNVLGADSGTVEHCQNAQASRKAPKHARRRPGA
eukprot:1136292-Alexandrium_andersonii.AAC.1